MPRYAPMPGPSEPNCCTRGLTDDHLRVRRIHAAVGALRNLADTLQAHADAEQMEDANANADENADENAETEAGAEARAAAVSRA